MFDKGTEVVVLFEPKTINGFLATEAKHFNQLFKLETRLGSHCCFRYRLIVNEINSSKVFYKTSHTTEFGATNVIVVT